MDVDPLPISKQMATMSAICAGIAEKRVIKNLCAAVSSWGTDLVPPKWRLAVTRPPPLKSQVAMEVWKSASWLPWKPSMED